MENLNPLNGQNSTSFQSIATDKPQKVISETDESISKTSQTVLKEIPNDTPSLKDHKVTQESGSTEKISDLALLTIQTSSDEEDPFSSEILEPEPNVSLEDLFPRSAALDAKIQAMAHDGFTINLSNATNITDIQKILKQDVKDLIGNMFFKLTADTDNPFSLVEQADIADGYDFIVQENIVITKESNAEAILDALKTHGAQVGIDMSKPLNVIVVSDELWEELKESLAEFRHSNRVEVKEPVKQQRARESENRDRAESVVQEVKKEEVPESAVVEEPVTVLDEKLHDKAAVEDYRRQEAAKVKDEDYVAKMRRIQDQQIFKANLKYQEKIPMSERAIKRKLTGGGR